MKKLAVIFLALIPSLVWAQRLKYKELFPLLSGFSMERQKNELKEYLISDLDNPNANFRLAIIYEQYYRRTDPLTNYTFVMANAEQAKIRYIKSKLLVTEKEVEHNNEYYAPIFKIFDAKGKPIVPFANVSAKIAGGYDSANLFLAKLPPIYKTFTKSVNFYDQAVRSFASITNEFASPEDLYLLYDDQLDERFSKLKSDYDSCLIYFDRYLQLIHEYPIEGHKQAYKVKSIVTYRLDGLLTGINFLTNSIELWDYGKWVADVRKKVQTDVMDLRKKLVAANTLLDESLNKISTAQVSEILSPKKLEKQMVFNLNNLDRQSAILSLLEFKAYKQQLDVLSKQVVLDTTFTLHNVDGLTNLIYANRHADTLLQELKTRLSPGQINKHKDFVTKFYGGQPGLEKYSSEQAQKMKDSFEEYQIKTKSNLIGMAKEEEAFSNKESAIKTGRFSVPLLQQTPTPEALDQGLLFTQFNRKNPDGTAYVAGIFKPDKKKNLVSTFLLKINSDGKPAWFKEVNASVDSAVTADAHSYLGPLVLTQEGCALIVRSVHAVRGDVQNTFVYFNDKGEERSRKRMKEKSFPRFLLYTERSNSFLLVSKGAEKQEKFSAIEPIETVGINVLGEIMWKRQSINIAGTLSDVVSLADGYLLAGNYFIMNDSQGKEVRTKMNNGMCSPYVIRISDRGDVEVSKPFVASASFYLLRLAKVSDMSIHLLGSNQSMEAGLGSPAPVDEKTLHIMTNKFGQVVYASY